MGDAAISRISHNCTANFIQGDLSNQISSDYHSHFLIGDTHCSTSPYFCHDGLPQYKPTHVTPLFKTSERSCCTGTVPVPYLTWKAYHYTASFSNTYLIFSLSSLESYRHLKVLKKFPLSTTICSVPNFKAHIVPTAKSSQVLLKASWLSHPQCSLLWILSHIFISFSPLMHLQKTSRREPSHIHLVFCLLHYQQSYVEWLG